MRVPPLSLAAFLCSAATAFALDNGPASLLAANQAAMGSAPRGELTLTYAYAGQGMTGSIANRYDLTTGSFVDSQAIGPLTMSNGFDGRQAWMEDMSHAITPEAGGDKRQVAVNEAYRNANLWWRADRAGAMITGPTSRTDGGRTFDVLSVTPRGGKSFEAWFDASTHLLARVVEKQSTLTVVTTTSDYRAVHGLQVPGKVVVDDGQGPSELQIMTFTRADLKAGQLVSAYAPPKVVFTDAVMQNATGRTTVPFKLLNNHIYAQVKINGKGPFFAIFDTGGHDLLTPETAKALEIRTEGDATGSGAGEGTVSVGFARGVTFQVGDVVLKDQTIAVLPITQTAVEGFDEQGMMGFELFHRFVTVIDYGAKTLTFIDPKRFNPRDAGVAVPFVFYDHLPQVKGTFEGLPGVFDIDTGSRSEITVTKPFADANHMRDTHKGMTAVDGWGVGGRSTSYVVRAKGMTLGSVPVTNIIAGLSADKRGSMSDENYQGNVGSRLLKRFVVTFDYDHQVMYLKRLPEPVADIATWDRSGLWVNLSDKGLKIVDVAAGSAGEAAGLKVGDEITTVDGAPASSVGLSDLRARLRDPGVPQVALTVESGGQSRRLDLKLKDQI